MGKELLKVGIIGCFAILLLLAIEWLIVCGLIKLICVCFGFTFSWAIATGVFFIFLLIKSVFGKASGGE